MPVAKEKREAETPAITTPATVPAVAAKVFRVGPPSSHKVTTVVTPHAQHSAPERRPTPVDHWQVDEQHAAKGEDQAQRAFDALQAADEERGQQIEGCK